MQVSEKQIVVDENLSLNQGAIKVSGWYLIDIESNLTKTLKQLADKHKFSLDIPWKNLKKKYKDIIFMAVMTS